MKIYHHYKFLRVIEDEETFENYYAFVCRVCNNHTTIVKQEFWGR